MSVTFFLWIRIRNNWI